jgi:CheY-like chemotaxis protein
MTGIFGRMFTKPTLPNFDVVLPRERLIQSGRILFIDDESPILLDELRQAGFAVDHDKTGDDIQKFDQQLYDVAIIDYHGVGNRLGTGQGLEVIKHIRRVSPRTRLVAYTSRSLTATESEFFRLSHVVLPKDLGLGDSLAIVETELRKAFGKEHLFEALIAKLDRISADDRERLKEDLVKALKRNDENFFKRALTKIGGAAAVKAVGLILSKLFIPH